MQKSLRNFNIELSTVLEESTCRRPCRLSGWEPLKSVVSTPRVYNGLGFLFFPLWTWRTYSQPAFALRV